MQAAACNKDDAANHNVARSSLASPGNIIKEESSGARRFSSLHHAAENNSVEQEGDAGKEKNEKARDDGPAFQGKGQQLMSFIGGGGGKTASEKIKNRKPAFKFDSFPLWLREGPWTWSAWLYLCGFFLFLIYIAPAGIETFPNSSQAPTYTWKEEVGVASCCAWSVYILYIMLRDVGPFPLATFTMLSWCILLFRMLCLLLAPYSSFFSVMGTVLHGPALINAVVVAAVWWGILVPLITWVIKTPADRTWFIKFNFSFFLLNVHCVNVALAYVVYRWEPRSLVFFDLWCALVGSMGYLVFYQSVLDPRGIHLYIILSPRTHLCVLSYSMLISSFVAVYWGAGGDMTFLSKLY